MCHPSGSKVYMPYAEQSFIGPMQDPGSMGHVQDPTSKIGAPLGPIWGPFIYGAHSGPIWGTARHRILGTEILGSGSARPITVYMICEC